METKKEDEWIDEPTKPAKPEVKTEPEAVQRKEDMKAKKKAVKAKAKKAKIAQPKKAKTVKKAKPAKKAKIVKKAKKANRNAQGKVTINQKLVPAEATAIKKLAATAEHGRFKGNVTQLIRFKVLGLKTNKETLAAIRKTTRT